MANLSILEREEKKQKQRKRSSLILVILLLLSTAGFALSSISNNNSSPNKPTNTDGPVFSGQYWVYTINGRQIIFNNERKNIDFTNVSMSKTLLDFSGKQVFIDTEGTVGLETLSIDLGAYVPKIQQACYGKCERDLPEKSCNTTDQIIIVRDTPEMNITESENCTFINGGLAGVDAFNYNLLGISQ